MRRSGSCRRCGPNEPSIGSRCSTRPTRAWCGTTHRTTSTSLRSSWTTYSWFTPVPRFRPTGWCVSRRNWRSMSHCSPGSRSRSRRPTGGDQVRSGSIVVAGEGRFQATAVGADAYAAKLTAEARRYSVKHSELVSARTGCSGGSRSRGAARRTHLPQHHAPPAHPVSYTHLRAHETVLDLVCRLLLE